MQQQGQPETAKIVFTVSEMVLQPLPPLLG